MEEESLKVLSNDKHYNSDSAEGETEPQSRESSLPKPAERGCLRGWNICSTWHMDLYAAFKEHTVLRGGGNHIAYFHQNYKCKSEQSSQEEVVAFFWVSWCSNVLLCFSFLLWVNIIQPKNSRLSIITSSWAFFFFFATVVSNWNKFFLCSPCTTLGEATGFVLDADNSVCAPSSDKSHWKHTSHPAEPQYPALELHFKGT